MAGTAIPATGVAWDTAIPDDGQPHGNDYNEHRETKLAVETRMNKEHVTFAGSSAGGEHKPGSARIYVGDYSSAAAGDALPTTKPDGATALDSDDAGMLAYDTDATYGGLLYKWSGSAWEEFMVSLLADQTIAGTKTFSGQIVSSLAIGTKPLDVTSTTKCDNLNADKVDGYDVAAYAGAESYTFAGGLIIKMGYSQSTADTDETFAFGTAFPNACISVVLSVAESNTGLALSIATSSVTVDGFHINRYSSLDGNIPFYWIAIGY